jgi:hypothetical protein
LERIPLVAQVPILDQERLEETEEVLVRCDSCTARALVRASMPFGTLFFCMHHYNKHATALKEKGAKATPLF